MQLRFTPDEFQMLVDIVEERDEELRAAMRRAADSEQQLTLAARHDQLQALEDKIIARDLQLMTDELELLGDVVDQAQRTRTAEWACTANRARKLVLQTEEEALKRIHDKIIETCAMF
jgi:acyl-CoA reductase-like NAD-dependent aldehyde dehydrogenase